MSDRGYETMQDRFAELARAQIRPNETHEIRVTSSAFGQDGFIPNAYSAYHEGASPPLAWTAIPGAKSYALIVEDPDAPRPEPFIHWLAWNIPGSVTSLLEQMGAEERPPAPQGMVQGRNGMGETGWFGPRPPEGDPRPHRYHFQVFALDDTLDLSLNADKHALLAAMQGHVIGQGDLVGVFQGKGRRQ
jgi:Raf kinase inhibitor-like YbhB/YbcL family protein